MGNQLHFLQYFSRILLLVVLVEELGVGLPRENHQPLKKIYHISHQFYSE